MVSLVILLSIIVSVAFFTLVERKVLGYIQMRKGPNKPIAAGFAVPFADAIKLFFKEVNYPSLSNKFVFVGVSFLIMRVPIIL